VGRYSRRLIVGSAGSSNSFGTIQSAREHWGDSVFIVAIDTNRRELVGASALADAFVRVPPARSAEFPDALRHIANSYPGSSYLPIHDEEIEVAVQLGENGALPAEIDLVAPPYEVVRLCSDKWAMHEWLTARGLPSPVTVRATPTALEQICGSAILKQREGCGAKSVQIVHAAAELAGVDPERWLLQAHLHPPEIGIDVFLSRNLSAFHCVCREYFHKSSSVATKVRVFHDPALSVIAESLARNVPICGAFLVQVMKDATGSLQIIDVNPRVGSSTRICAALGMDFAAANLADHWGEPIDGLFRPLVGEHYVVRQYADYVTSRP